MIPVKVMGSSANRVVTETELAYASYRVIRRDFLAAAEKADEAWLRWFRKLERGERTNGAQASRLANEASYLSAELASAEGRLYALEIDPRDVDKMDGIDPSLLP